MYLIYKWMLSGENQHCYNRAILLTIYLCAIVIPPAMPLVYGWLTPDAQGIVITEGLTAMTGTPADMTDEPHVPLLPRILLAVYLAGIVITSFYTVLVGIKLRRIISRGEKMAAGRYTLVITAENDIAPFSWLRYIVMSREDYTASGNIIMTHETRHLRLVHWADLLFAQIIAIFQWYNPSAWLMREELKTVHEYQADEAVLASGADTLQYQMLLIKKAVGARFPSLANSLNHSKLKKRVTMMYKSKSSATRRMRTLALIPAAAIALVTINLPVVASALTAASEAEIALPVGKGNEKTAEAQTAAKSKAGTPVAPAVGNRTKNDAKTLSVTPSNVKALIEGEMDATSQKLSGNPEVYVDGVKQGTYEECFKKLDPDKIESITVKKSGNSDGMILVTLKKDKPASAKPAAKSEEVAAAVEKMPQFPGGEPALMRFVADNIRYPESAAKEDKQGRVVVSFTIGADGKVCDPQVIRSIDPALDAEACRVVSIMPDFIPGTIDGKPVTCHYTIPISFKLQGDSDEKKDAQ